VRYQKNLKYLQRLDTNVTSILGSATHVSMYQLDPSSFKWTVYDCAGPLFVVERNTDPRFQFVISNRQNRNNFTHSMTATFDFELSERFINFKSQLNDAGATPTIYGIWFHADEERTNIYDIMARSVEVEKKTYE